MRGVLAAAWMQHACHFAAAGCTQSPHCCMSTNLPAFACPPPCSAFPVVGFTSILDVAQAFSLAGFGFYLQAMLMPM